jgi:hypothetical protein
MLNPMNGKILELEKKQATEEKKEFTIWDIMEERPHSAMCNHMYLILMRIFKKNCPGRELPESVLIIMKFAFRNVLDMIQPDSMSDKNWYLGQTQDTIDEHEGWAEQEEWDAKQKDDTEQQGDDAEQEECAADDSSEDTFHRGLTQQEDDAEQEECAADDSREDSAWWL